MTSEINKQALSQCEFDTSRLHVEEWRRIEASEWDVQPLEEVVAELLVDEVTRWLPESWQGKYDRQRALEWTAERDEEGSVLLVIDKEVKVYEYVLKYGWAMLGAAFGPQVILAVLWKRASYAGCLFGMLTGFVVAIVWAAVYDKDTTGIEIYNLPLAFIAALVVNVLVSLIVPSPARAGAPPTATGD